MPGRCQQQVAASVCPHYRQGLLLGLPQCRHPGQQSQGGRQGPCGEEVIWAQEPKGRGRNFLQSSLFESHQLPLPMCDAGGTLGRVDWWLYAVAFMRTQHFVAVSHLAGGWSAPGALWLVDLRTVKGSAGAQGQQRLQKSVLVHTGHFQPEYNDDAHFLQ